MVGFAAFLVLDDRNLVVVVESRFLLLQLQAQYVVLIVELLDELFQFGHSLVVGLKALLAHGLLVGLYLSGLVEAVSEYLHLAPAVLYGYHQQGGVGNQEDAHQKPLAGGEGCEGK